MQDIQNITSHFYVEYKKCINLKFSEIVEKRMNRRSIKKTHVFEKQSARFACDKITKYNSIKNLRKKHVSLISFMLLVACCNIELLNTYFLNGNKFLDLFY